MSGLWALVYAVTALACWIPFAVALIFQQKREFPSLRVDTTDYAMCVSLGAMMAMVWPLCLVVLAMVTVVRRIVEADDTEKARQ